MHIIAKRICTNMKVPFETGFDFDHRWGKVYLSNSKESAIEFCKKELGLYHPYNEEDGEIIYTNGGDDPIHIITAVNKQEDLEKDHKLPKADRETVIRVSQGEIPDKYVVLTQISCTEKEKIERYLHNLTDFVENDGECLQAFDGHYYWGQDLKAFVFDKPELAFLFAVGVLGMDFKEASADILNAKQKVDKTEKKFAAVSFTADDLISLSKKTESWTEDKAEKWLANNQKYIRETMLEAGLKAIDALIDTYGSN